MLQKHTHEPSSQGEVVEQFGKSGCFVATFFCKSMRVAVTERKIYRGAGTKANN